MKAYVFPGQGSQFPGMAEELYQIPQGKKLFDTANDILGFPITEIMFKGTKEDLTKTGVTQPAIFLHSTILALTSKNFQPSLVAGHSLGEFSALVANQTLTFEDGLKLVKARSRAMQKACETNPGTMAAILGLESKIVESVCASVDGTVVPANYNSPGQVVISGEKDAVMEACERLKQAGARKAIPLPVHGAFHSPLMESARATLASAIRETTFNTPSCPIVQNVDANIYSEVAIIQQNLISQLTQPVKWTQTIRKMIDYGVTEFIETGPGKVLRGLISKINDSVEALNLES